ncbi:MAG TPA: hypothetical protein PLY93_03930, partial [Turneriella sp.]|nr:hypothetical protein [Turneriella sp.]
MRVAHVLFSDSAGEAALLPRTPPQWNLSRPTLSPVFVEWLWGNHARTLAAYRNKKHTTHAYFYCATPMPRWKA